MDSNLTQLQQKFRMLDRSRPEDDEVFLLKQNTTAPLIKAAEPRQKKRSIPVERERLYSQNLQLKNKIQQLMQRNVRIKAQLTKTEKQKIDICTIAEEEILQPKIMQRSTSGLQKSSSRSIYGQNGLISSSGSLSLQQRLPVVASITKEKNAALLKRLNREAKVENDKLLCQIQRLKHTMKFTRINELVAQNTQLGEEAVRLRNIINDHKMSHYQRESQLEKQVEGLKKKLKEEQTVQKRSERDLKEQIRANNELKDKLRQIQARKVQADRRVQKELKFVKNENIELKSKVAELSQTTSECQRQLCLKKQQQIDQLKARHAQQQKKQSEIKEVLSKVKADLENAQKEWYQAKAQLQYSQEQLQQVQSELAEKEKQTMQNEQYLNNTIKDLEIKLQQMIATKHASSASSSRIVEPKESSTKPQNKDRSGKQEQARTQKESISSKEATEKKQRPSRPKGPEKQGRPSDKAQTKQQPVSKERNRDRTKKEVNGNDSIDTEKLLESIQEDNQNEQSLSKKNQALKEQDSDGGYENLQFQEEEPDQKKIKNQKIPNNVPPSGNGKTHSQTGSEPLKATSSAKGKEKNQKKKSADSAKEEKAKIEKGKAQTGKGQGESRSEKDKAHKKEKQKVQEREERSSSKEEKQIQSQQALKQVKKQQKQSSKVKRDEQRKGEDTKKVGSEKKQGGESVERSDERQAKLKAIKQCLIYRFMGQGYSYDDFIADIKKNNVHQFAIADVMVDLGQQPFLLKDEQIQPVVQFIFQTQASDMTGEEILAAKDFVKKMKKFIGKAKKIDPNEIGRQIQQIKQAVAQDSSGSNELSGAFFQGDSGDGTVPREVFAQAMAKIGVTGEVLETALSQAAIISVDLDHINYEEFFRGCSA